MDFGKDWDAKDTALFLAAMGSFRADAESTKDNTRRGVKERNPVLGERPAESDVDRYFSGISALTGGAAAILPPKWRKIGLGALAGFESGVVMDNKGSGKAPQDSLTPWAGVAIGGLLGHLMTGSDSKFSISASQDSKKNVNLLLGYKTEF